jgi:predicted RNA-binding Zn-ribbon protein involved in translation (DUF1610 family)
MPYVDKLTCIAENVLTNRKETETKRKSTWMLIKTGSFTSALNAGMLSTGIQKTSKKQAMIGKKMDCLYCKKQKSKKVEMNNDPHGERYICPECGFILKWDELNLWTFC